MITNSLLETYQLAKDFLENLSPEKSEATTIGLSGDLGSGKTSFVQGVAKALGIKEQITSPTFVLMKFYTIPENSKYSQLIHIDAYRLDDEKEFSVLGFKEIQKNPKNLIMIEWPERVATAFSGKMKKIDFKFLDESRREIKY